MPTAQPVAGPGPPPYPASDGCVLNTNTRAIIKPLTARWEEKCLLVPKDSLDTMLRTLTFEESTMLVEEYFVRSVEIRRRAFKEKLNPMRAESRRVKKKMAGDAKRIIKAGFKAHWVEFRAGQFSWKRLEILKMMLKDTELTVRRMFASGIQDLIEVEDAVLRRITIRFNEATKEVNDEFKVMLENRGLTEAQNAGTRPKIPKQLRGGPLKPLKAARGLFRVYRWAC